jgi:hypothetical protein
MYKIILATTSPLQYGDQTLSKSHASLKRVARRKSLPLVLEHDGSRVGAVTNLAYQLRDGVGYLVGQIQDLWGKAGASLQYSGNPVGNEIQISSVDHVALVDAPRDPVAVFSDSVKAKFQYRDSVTETGTPEAPPEAENPETTETGTPGTEVELTDEVIDQLYESIFSTPDRLLDLVNRIKAVTELKEEPQPEPPQESKEEPKVESKPTRLIFKPREAKTSVQKTPPKMIQQPFRGLP